MKVECVWEHNGDDSLLYATQFVGAFTRGKTRDEAIRKMPSEIMSYRKWTGDLASEVIEPEVVQEKVSKLMISDADSDVIFDDEKKVLGIEEYQELKALVLKSAQDFLLLYQSVPDPNATCWPVRNTFYGQIPRTAYEMYEHTKNVTDYYFGEIGVETDNEGSIVECRRRGFALLEGQHDYLRNSVRLGSHNEEWSVRKVLRRFVCHDRIHAKAMYRMATKTFGSNAIPDVFFFDYR